MNNVDKVESQRVIQYSLVALTGLIAGIVIGGLFGSGWHVAQPVPPPAQSSHSHP